MIFKASLDKRDACCLAISCKALCNLTTDSKLACTDVNLVWLDVINIHLIPMLPASFFNKARGWWLALKNVTSFCARVIKPVAYLWPMTDAIVVLKACIMHLHLIKTVSKSVINLSLLALVCHGKVWDLQQKHIAYLTSIMWGKRCSTSRLVFTILLALSVTMQAKLLRAPSVYLFDDHGCTIEKIVRLSTKLLLLQDCTYEVYLIDFPLCVRWKTGHQLWVEWLCDWEK